MRRIIATGAAAAALTYLVLSTAGTEGAHAQSKKAAKTAAAPTYGNADAITETELKVYDYFLASDQLEGRYFPSVSYTHLDVYKRQLLRALSSRSRDSSPVCVTSSYYASRRVTS